MNDYPKFQASYMKEALLESGQWKYINGLYWNCKRGHRSLKEAYSILIEDKLVKEYSKMIFK